MESALDLNGLAAGLGPKRTVVVGNWFGKPCLKVGGKVFAALWQGDMAFKLAGEAHAEALRVEGGTSTVDTYRADTYGQRIAGVYDDWYDVIDPATVPVLAELAQVCPGGRARQGGRALELGIGTGRVAIPLREAGVSVEGIDASEAMVARMQAKPGGDEIPVVIGDMADIAVEGEYALIYVLFNTFFSLLTQEDQVRCFRNVARHLEPGGSFVLECFVPDPARLAARQGVRASEVGEDVLRLEAAQINLAKQLIASQTVLLTEEGLKLYPVKIRYVWPSEMDLMAQLAGLKLRHRWASWRKEPFTASSKGHVSVYGWA